ncbi:DUF1801 domain-containing protein [Mucilaginibacter sp. HMF5004]|uniref:DUF1801 domain-containing protein n=1 Tax=Mucilaginibacter rivuli TaxID=2857527 RepID=UPI001C5E49D0|nr:DUF1801 domain-containing protein [Mucilaginibacter rivuli]MBW4891545.1 DUF1801 domain-containing protein [Mucilaginibacter rivuli]
MTIAEHLDQKDPIRQPLLKALHEIIIKNDPSVEAVVGTMMGKEMILYNDRGSFKYGLAAPKEYMSLHVLPMYMNAPLHEKYVNLLPKAKFQKGCINFKNADEIPLTIAAQLITDCAPIDLIKIRQDYLDAKKKKK